MADENLSGSMNPIGAAPLQPLDDQHVQVSGPSVKITVRPNGPFRVEGAIALVDVSGKEWDLTGKPAISLCRCGLSSKRPFCDGEHGRQGWKCDASPIPALPVAQG